jgi:hypothetical protein
MTSYSSSNSVPVDSPFAKMLANKIGLPFVMGIPPISTTMSGANTATYEKAAAILGLSGDNPQFLARRIRHLSYIVRQSRFADRANWRSALEAVDDLIPIIDEPDGLTLQQTSSFLQYFLVKTGVAADNKLVWRISVSGTYPSLQAYVDGAAVGDSFSNQSNQLPIGDSGYSISYTCSGGSGDSINFSGTITVPYSGNCAPIYTAIKQNYDFINQIAYGKADYLSAIFTDAIVEDAIAAFILAVDEL